MLSEQAANRTSVNATCTRSPANFRIGFMKRMMEKVGARVSGYIFGFGG